MNILEFTEKNNITLMDKFDLGLMSQVYNKILTQDFNSRVNRVLEIGISDGRSILLWRDYFTGAEITGIDIDYCKLLDNQPRVNQLTTNAYNLRILDSLGKFDFIIDDGPHTVESQLFFLTHYPKLLNPGGILVLEDILVEEVIPTYIQLAKICGRVEVIELSPYFSEKQKEIVKRKSWDRCNALILYT
jgi:SAM-dependent methyltransferase